MFTVTFFSISVVIVVCQSLNSALLNRCLAFNGIDSVGPLVYVPPILNKNIFESHSEV